LLFWKFQSAGERNKTLSDAATQTDEPVCLCCSRSKI